MSYFPGYLIQTLDDKSAKEAVPFRQPLMELVKCGDPKAFNIDLLKEMNGKGAGIYFTPNNFSGARRLADNCKGINAWFMECDDCSKEDQMKMIDASKLPPSFIVETGKSYHCYWLAKDGKIENFREMQKRLIEAFDADKSNIDASRVFRVPGFNHMKKEPFAVGIVRANPKNVYTEEEMRLAFPLREPLQKHNVFTIVSKPKVGRETLWDCMAEVNNKQMLEMLSGDSMVNSEVFTFRNRTGGGEFIDVDGKPSDAWIDIKGMIGSGKRGGPTWIQWLQYYGRSKVEIATWFKSQFPDSWSTDEEDDYDDSFESINEKSFSQLDKERIIWGVPQLDRDATIMDRGSYVMIVGETSSGKTPFALQMALENARAGLNVAFVSLEMPNDALCSRWARNMAGYGIEEIRARSIDKEVLAKEMKKLNHPMLAFVKCHVDNVADLEKYFKKKRPEIMVIDNIGFVQADRLATENARDKEVSRALLNLSKNYGVTIIALQHFRKRSGDTKSDGGITFRTIDSISGSAKFSHDITHLIQVARVTENATRETQEDFCVLVQKDRPYDHKGLYNLKYRKGLFQ